MAKNYSLHQSLQFIKGVGPALAEKFADKGLNTVQDLLLYVPLRYEDRSQRVTIDQLKQQGPEAGLVTLKAKVTYLNNYYKGRRSMQTVHLQDETGRLKAMWFNNRFIIDRLARGQEYLFSGKINPKGILLQPLVEADGDDTIHTDRLIPVYSATLGIKIGLVRRILHEVITNLDLETDWLIDNKLTNSSQVTPLKEALSQLHFPDEENKIVEARERLALEELLSLIEQSHQIKSHWEQQQTSTVIRTGIVSDPKKLSALIPKTVPFELTKAQQRATKEILEDLESETPMNRILVGDVGSGKTVVAGIAAVHTLDQGQSVALIAPTQILAQQHSETLEKLFPKLNFKLITGKKSTQKDLAEINQPTFFIGTHAVLNKLDLIKPALVIFDEQHRFGVKQRTLENGTSETTNTKPKTKQKTPHVLTMSATPIPRSYMLTIFAHLSLSTIDEMPLGRKTIKTWLVPKAKNQKSLEWLCQETQQNQSLALIVCPFINQSKGEALANVTSATTRYEEVLNFTKKKFPDLKVALLHGKMTNKEKETVTNQLFNQEINILVTTPIVEVGLDVPTANIVVIEAAERFGLASLHQLRGRVGRAGQQAYCLLFTTHEAGINNDRLQHFTQENNGLKLAEQDLKTRGAGDIFGSHQHGFDQLRFANWTNFELVGNARKIYDQIENLKQQVESPLTFSQKSDQLPVAN